ncbi:hypothetical protein PG985_005759 [Apiospora marii]|uniref:uncharacterized protein n=1 Tax=Apiospora marii TaxID=335849 RepID=UPI00312F0441
MDLPARHRLRQDWRCLAWCIAAKMDEFDSYPYDSFDDDRDAAFGFPSLSPQALVNTQQSWRASLAPSEGFASEESLQCANRRQLSIERATLPLLQLADWKEDEAYNNEPPRCIHYSIEFKVIYNNRVLLKDTEPDLVLAPGAYWLKFLQPKLERLVKTKLRRTKDLVQINNTIITVSVRDRLIRHIEEGYPINCYDDMPDFLRTQLYAEEQQDTERKQKRKRDASPRNLPSIQITNVLPGQSNEQASEEHPVACSSPITICGLRDRAVKRYCEWQCTKVDDVVLKFEFRKARDLTLAEGFDLEQLHEDQDYQFLLDKGVKLGIARRFVRDVKSWASLSNDE